MTELAIEAIKAIISAVFGGGLVALLSYLRKPKEDEASSRERDKRAFRKQWLAEIERLHESHAEVEKRFNERCDEVIELMAENIVLKAKNATLEKRVTELEARITELESFRRNGN